MRAAARFAALALLGLTLAGCATSLGAPGASLTTVDAIRTSGLQPISVGAFVPGGKVSASDDRSVTIRAINSFKAPDGSFAGYLKSTLEQDLKTAGKLDPGAPATLTGVLTDSQVSSAMGTGTASLSAHFTLTRDGKAVFDKELSVNASWPSSFIGAEAIPDAINNYTGLYEKLASALFDDPDFRAAAGAH